MTSRPFVSSSIEDLEAAFARAISNHDVATLKALAHELGFRTTARASDLGKAVAKVLPGLQAGSGAADRIKDDAPEAESRKKRHGSDQALGARTRAPTAEQEQAIDLFRRGGALKINAYAGTGKTSTLEMLAHSTGRRGQYLAFNRNIVGEARMRFPESVVCSTTHSLAFKAMAPKYSGVGDKLTGRINANQVADILKLKHWRIDSVHSLPPRSQGFLILDTVRRFAMSADIVPSCAHVPHHGSLRAAPPQTLDAVTEFAVRGAKHVWERMKDAKDGIPLGHDGYLKLWALAQPRIAADFILMDEAQDTSPVVLEVLRAQPAQMVYVGDKYQQIYEWRGAVNAMDAIPTEHSTYLTTSFRFGDGIAKAASQLLALMNEQRPLRGNPAVDSVIGPTKPRAILARTNAYTIGAVIDALDSGKRPHLVGGTAELMDMLRGVSDLMRGEPSSVPDFFGFPNWNAVVEFTRSDEGEHLRTFVSLVEQRGERQLKWALGQTVEEEACDLVVSTAHKAKGREWPTVRLTDDFVRSQPTRPKIGAVAPKCPYEPSELRLLYVALTRAKIAVDVPPPLLSLLGIRHAPVDSLRDPGPVERTATRHQARAAPTPEPVAPPSLELPKNWQPSQVSAFDADKPGDAVGKPVPTRRRGFLDWLVGRTE